MALELVAVAIATEPVGVGSAPPSTGRPLTIEPTRGPTRGTLLVRLETAPKGFTPPTIPPTELRIGATAGPRPGTIVDRQVSLVFVVCKG